MKTKRNSTGSTLTPRERERLLKEAEERARAREERPERQAANAVRLAQQHSGRIPGSAPSGPHVDLETRVRTAERTRNAAMDAWKLEHEAQLARDD